MVVVRPSGISGIRNIFTEVEKLLGVCKLRQSNQFKWVHILLLHNDTPHMIHGEESYLRSLRGQLPNLKRNKIMKVPNLVWFSCFTVSLPPSVHLLAAAGSRSIAGDTGDGQIWCVWLLLYPDRAGPGFSSGYTWTSFQIILSKSRKRIKLIHLHCAPAAGVNLASTIFSNHF